MNKNIILGAIGIIIVGVSAYYLGSRSANVASDGHTDHAHEVVATSTHNMTGISGHAIADGTTMNMANGAKLAGTRIIVNNTSFKPGRQNLSFILYGTDGDAWGDKDLKIDQEKKMHFIVASNDFSSYQHIHPEFKDKNWQVELELKGNTGYQAYVDIDSNESGKEILRFPITLGTVNNTPRVSQNNTTLTVDNTSVEMQIEGSLVAGRENNILFKVKQNGKVVLPDNYLGAKGHLVVLGDNPDTYIHGHPVPRDESDVHFVVSFTNPGTYTLFSQFKVGGIVRTYPFTVSVNAGNSSSNTVDESKPHSH